MSSRVYETLKIVQKGLTRTIIFNRPAKGNSWNSEFFAEFPEALDDAALDQNTLVCVLTGAGRFYTTGLDISRDNDESKNHLRRGPKGNLFSHFVNFPKPLVAIVNGAAIGGGLTHLALCDFVYASDKAIFRAPFATLGLNAEGCSSYTFPRAMGFAKASEILLLAKTLTAHEAEKVGLVTRVFPQEVLQEEAWKQIDQLASLPPQALLESKKLIRSHVKENMLRANDNECESQRARTSSEEFRNAIKISFEKLKNKKKHL